MQTPESEVIVRRFFTALEELKARGFIRGKQTFTTRYGINRWNMSTLEKEPQRDIFQPAWLEYLVRDYGVSAHWLLTGEGKIFKNEQATQRRLEAEAKQRKAKRAQQRREKAAAALRVEAAMQAAETAKQAAETAKQRAADAEKAAQKALEKAAEASKNALEKAEKAKKAAEEALNKKQNK